VDADLISESERVLEAVREAAQRPLDEGAADLRLSTVEELYGPDADYDCPVVVLTPRRAASARVTVEVQDVEQWWLAAGGGPGYELYAGMQRDRYALLRKLVAAVVAGQYEDGWEQRRQRLLLRPWRHRVVHLWIARFGAGPDAEATVHHTRPEENDRSHRRFEPYV
jgi:hypothetical protein